MKYRTPNDDNYGTPVIFCRAYVKDVISFSLHYTYFRDIIPLFQSGTTITEIYFLKSLVSLIGWLDSHQKFVNTFFEIRAAAGKYRYTARDYISQSSFF